VDLENRVFSKDGSAAISDGFVAVRMLGGTDLDDAGRAFMERYGIEGYPTLLAMTAEGDVLARDLPRELEGILGALAKAKTDNEAFLAKRDVLAKKADLGSLTELADLYLGRENYAVARGLYERIAREKPDGDVLTRLAGILRRLGDKPAERKLLETAVAKHPGDARSAAWRIRLATLEIPTQAQSREEWLAVVEKQAAALSALFEVVRKEGKPEVEAAVRAELGTWLREKGDAAGSKAHFDWILENAPKSPSAAVAHLKLAEAALGAEDFATVVEHLEILARDHPGTDEGRVARENVERFRQAAKKAAEEKEKEKEGEKGDEPGKDGGR
jgi:tetratricopeptide (TPR) repeat protein